MYRPALLSAVCTHLIHKNVFAGFLCFPYVFLVIWPLPGNLTWFETHEMASFHMPQILQLFSNFIYLAAQLHVKKKCLFSS